MSNIAYDWTIASSFKRDDPKLVRSTMQVHHHQQQLRSRLTFGKKHILLALLGTIAVVLTAIGLLKSGFNELMLDAHGWGKLRQISSECKQQLTDPYLEAGRVGLGAPPSCAVSDLPDDPLVKEYGMQNLRLSRVYEGSGTRVRRVLQKAMRGEKIKIAVVGGSVSAVSLARPMLLFGDWQERVLAEACTEANRCIVRLL